MAEERRADLMAEELQRLKALGRAAVVEEERSKFVIFALPGGLYAFPGADVREILTILEIFPVPGAPAGIPGVINNRGEIEAVADLAALLGLPGGDRGAAGRIVMAEKGGVRCGMLVDTVVDVVDLPPSAIKPPLATLGEAVRDLVAGETDHRGASVVLLDVGRILDRLGTHGR